MDAPGDIIQLKVRLLGISPMIWRRVMVPATMTLHELHGVLQVAMGWEGIGRSSFISVLDAYFSWLLLSIARRQSLFSQIYVSSFRWDKIPDSEHVKLTSGMNFCCI